MEWKQLSSMSHEELREYQVWLFKEAVRLESEYRKLNIVKEKFSEERIQFREEMFEINEKYKNHKREKQLQRDEELIKKKLEILQEGFHKLDLDRKKLEKEKASWMRDKEILRNEPKNNAISWSEKMNLVFFKGVNSPNGLRKRYLDLMKIYHPDNNGGDAEVVQHITQEFEKLKQNSK